MGSTGLLHLEVASGSETASRKLFDPPGFGRLNSSKSPQDYVRVKLPVSPLLAVCILMSTAISTKQKIRFLLGVFDENDNRSFEEAEFIEMVSALFRGMAAMFGMLLMKNAAPSAERIEALAVRLFRRILAYQELQTGQVYKDSVPMEIIEQWLLGGSSDPLNVPFALFINRFSQSLEEDPEIFEEESRKFRLSHTCPVDVPMETAASLDKSFLNRHEVVVAEKLFSYCLSTGSFGISHEAAQSKVGAVDAPCTAIPPWPRSSSKIGAKWRLGRNRYVIMCVYHTAR